MRSKFMADSPEAPLTQARILDFGLAVELVCKVAQAPRETHVSQLVAALLGLPWDCGECSAPEVLRLLTVCKERAAAEPPTGPVSLPCGPV